MYHTLPESRAHDYVDGLLKSFFKRELPQPWPEATAAATDRGVTLGRHTIGRGRFTHFGRLALVASVALILIGYLSLAAKFPAVNDASGLAVDRDWMIGSVPRVNYESTPRGAKALIREWTLPTAKGEAPTIIINVQEIERPMQP